MKTVKQVLATACVAATLATPAVKADTLLGLYAGAQMWAMETEGSVATTANDLLAFAYDDERQGSYYIALEHFVPFVPNAKIVITSLETDGVANINSTFNFAGESFFPLIP